MPNAWPAMEHGGCSFPGQVLRGLFCSGEANHKSGESSIPNLEPQGFYTPAVSSVEEGYNFPELTIPGKGIYRIVGATFLGWQKVQRSLMEESSQASH